MKIWKRVFEKGEMFFIEKNVAIDTENGIILHLPKNIPSAEVREKFEKYVQLKRAWGSKYLEVFESGTEIENATIIIAVSRNNKERTFIL